MILVEIYDYTPIELVAGHKNRAERGREGVTVRKPISDFLGLSAGEELAERLAGAELLDETVDCDDLAHDDRTRTMAQERSWMSRPASMVLPGHTSSRARGSHPMLYWWALQGLNLFDRRGVDLR